MNPWLGPPDSGIDAWFDVWVTETGVDSRFETRGATDVLAVKERMREELDQLLSGHLPARRSRPNVDLDLPVVVLRVQHQPAGDVGSGWGPLAAPRSFLRTLGDLAKMARTALT